MLSAGTYGDDEASIGSPQCPQQTEWHDVCAKSCSLSDDGSSDYSPQISPASVLPTVAIPPVKVRPRHPLLVPVVVLHFPYVPNQYVFRMASGVMSITGAPLPESCPSISFMRRAAHTPSHACELTPQTHDCCEISHVMQTLMVRSQSLQNQLNNSSPSYQAAEVHTLQHQHAQLLHFTHTLIDDNDHCLAEHAELVSEVWGPHTSCRS